MIDVIRIIELNIFSHSKSFSGETPRNYLIIVSQASTSSAVGTVLVRQGLDMIVHPPHLPRRHLVRGHGLPEQAGVQPPPRVREPDIVSGPVTDDEKLNI